MMLVAAKRKLKADRVTVSPSDVYYHEKKREPRVRLVRNEEQRRKAARKAKRAARRAGR